MKPPKEMKYMGKKKWGADNCHESWVKALVASLQGLQIHLSNIDSLTQMRPACQNLLVESLDALQTIAQEVLGSIAYSNKYENRASQK